MASRRMQALLESGAVIVVEDDEVWGQAAECKCRVPVSLGDCYTLATAKKYGAKPLFLRPERELIENAGSVAEWLGPGPGG